MSETVELDLTEEEYNKIVQYYIEDNFSAESIEVYNENKNKDEPSAAFAALLNEALINAIKLGMGYEAKDVVK